MGRSGPVCLAVALLTVACASYEPSPVPVPLPKAIEWHEKNGLMAAAEPYVGEKRQEAYFDANFSASRIIALQVMTENTNEGQMLVHWLNMLMTLPDQQTIGPAPLSVVVNTVAEEGGFLTWEAPLGVLVGMAAVSAQEDARAARLADYRSKAFPQSTLFRGQSSRGFVFFIPPSGTEAFDEATLSVLFVDIDQGTSETVEVPLTGLGFGMASDEENEKQERDQSPPP